MQECKRIKHGKKDKIQLMKAEATSLMLKVLMGC